MSLCVGDGAARLAVEDDGNGDVRMTLGGGLAGLADRVGALDGQLSVEPVGGGGAAVRVVLPCG